MKKSAQYSRTLRLDKEFTPISIDEGDELFPNGIFEFNITKIINYIENNLEVFGLEEVEVANFDRDFSSINENYLDSIQNNAPVILAEISPNQFNLIDGHHRMEKARRKETKSLMAYKLYAHQHVAFLTSRKAYMAYVEYWNEKLRR